MLALLFAAAVVLGFVSGSLWIFSAALSALLVSMYPLTSMLLGLSVLTYLAYRHYERKD
jgi:hypothetical protein